MRCVAGFRGGFEQVRKVMELGSEFWEIKANCSFKVDNSLNDLNNERFVSAFKFPAHRHVLFFQSLMGDYDGSALSCVLNMSSEFRIA